MMKEIKLNTKRNHSSRYLLGSGSLDKLGEVLTGYDSNKVLVVSDRNVWQIHGENLNRIINKSGIEPFIYKIEPGEQSKNLTVFSDITDFALNAGVKRNTPLIAFGGGVTGDLAGYVAASLLRGIPLIQIPTTLLAMIDSSIGGKTGVNHETGKNLIGAFYQPDLVLCDTLLLNTLPEKEWKCGLGEIIKYGCIARPDFFDRLSFNHSQNPDESVIFDAASIKIKIVESDETEQGVRSWLNYGHTFAHALESHTGYSRFAHGEAVYIGLVAATRLSQLMGYPVDTGILLSYANSFSLKTIDLISSVEQLFQRMYSDKKIIGASLRMVLLENWGKPVILEIKDEASVKESWRFALEKTHN